MEVLWGRQNRGWSHVGLTVNKRTRWVRLWIDIDASIMRPESPRGQGRSLGRVRITTSIIRTPGSRQGRPLSGQILYGRLWPVGWGRQRQLRSIPVRRTWVWLTGRFRETVMAVLGRVPPQTFTGLRLLPGLSGRLGVKRPRISWQWPDQSETCRIVSIPGTVRA